MGEERGDFFSRLHFTWLHSQVFWMARAGDKLYIVNDRTYQREQALRLAELGMERRSWCTLIRPYEEALFLGADNCWALWQKAERTWRRLCDAQERIQRDLAFWEKIPEVTVQVITS